MRFLVVICMFQAVATMQLSPSLHSVKSKLVGARLQSPEDQVDQLDPEKLSTATAVSNGADLYDDDKPVYEKPAVSGAMRERLLRESRDLGADPNSKNPFLPVFAGFGIFVILGALAVNM